ncbi:MAG: hypothetical protein C0520_11355, partial [Sphingopyxis sp.]|nr:hypothetical protein [Sphingopyxis sp.]
PAAADAQAPTAIASVVAGAIEGPEVDLDALLGPAAGPNQPDAPLLLLAAATGGPLIEPVGPVGHSFMAGFADQHVAAQLEQAAAGHG